MRYTNRMNTIESLIETVKHNCDISDAQHWGYFSICGLLMRYRDLFRSEQGLAPWEPIDRAGISEWIQHKEQRWEALEEADLDDLMIGDVRTDPFDAFSVNNLLRAEGLVYGAGYGLYMKPSFFLARLTGSREVYDYTVCYAGREIARDIFASPGMLQGRCIFIRTEPLRTLLWEKFTECGARRESCTANPFVSYGFEGSEARMAGFTERFDGVVQDYADIVLHHEVGEAIEDVPEWGDILVSTKDRGAEYFLRAVKDLIADTSAYGPLGRIITDRNSRVLGLFVSFVERYRLRLFPEIRQAYEGFMQDQDWSRLEMTRVRGYDRFASLRQEILGVYRSTGHRERMIGRIGELRRQFGL
jgi:hypothetical protein